MTPTPTHGRNAAPAATAPKEVHQVTTFVTYNPAVFDVTDIDSAKRIILTPEDATTEHRWASETPYLSELFSAVFHPTPESLVLDYGCGIGRMSKELIARIGCRVIGVDISPGMRALAALYVDSDRFLTCTPDMLDFLIDRGIVFDFALSVWVLQHCAFPTVDISRIARALTPSGRLLVVNQSSRAVPTLEHGWLDDMVDIAGLLEDQFLLADSGVLDKDRTTEAISQQGYWATYYQSTASHGGIAPDAISNR